MNFLWLFSYGQLHKNSPFNKNKNASSCYKEEAENKIHDTLFFRIPIRKSLLQISQPSHDFLRPSRDLKNLIYGFQPRSG